MDSVQLINTIVTYAITLIAALIFAVQLLEKKWNRRDACLVAKDAIEILKSTEPVKATQLKNFLKPFCSKYWKESDGNEGKSKKQD